MAARVRPAWGGRVGFRNPSAAHGRIAPEPPKANSFHQFLSPYHPPNSYHLLRATGDTLIRMRNLLEAGA